MTKFACLCAVSWSASMFWRGRVNYGSSSQTPAPPNSTFATIIVSSNQTIVDDRHFKSNEPTTPCMLNQESAWNPDVISLSKGLEKSYWLQWFTETTTSTSIPPIRARRPPYAVEMRCFQKSHLDEETDLERNGTALLTDVPLAPDRGEGTSTFSPLNRT